MENLELHNSGGNDFDSPDLASLFTPALMDGSSLLAKAHNRAIATICPKDG